MHSVGPTSGVTPELLNRVRYGDHVTDNEAVKLVAYFGQTFANLEVLGVSFKLATDPVLRLYQTWVENLRFRQQESNFPRD